MATAKKPANPRKTASVEDFMRELEHPLKAEMQSVLEIIGNASPGISTGIKWNAPSFFYREWFATVNIRSNDAVQIILHLGAKVRTDINARIDIQDPNNLLQWLGKDRASIKFGNMAEIRKNTDDFQAIVSEWIGYLK